MDREPSAGAPVLRTLGDCQLWVGGNRVALRPREEGVLAAVALFAPHPVPVDAVAEVLWEVPPASSRKTIQNHVARARRAVPVDVLRSADGGYALARGVEVDHLAFRAEVARASGLTDVDARASTLARAVGRWRGEPFAPLPPVAPVLAERAHLLAQRRAAEELLAGALLDAGNAAAAVGWLERLLADDPYREHGWWLLMLALHRCGRRRDSLRAYERARETLRAGTGLEPGAELRALERRVLDDDPSLAADRPRHAVRAARPAVAGHARGALQIVGREAELERLRDAYRRAERSGGLAVVEGPAGIGKTALARAFGAWASGRGSLVLWGSCDRNPTVVLQPFVQVAEDLVGAVGAERVARRAGDDAPLLARLAPAIAAGPSPAARSGTPARMVAALGRALAGAAAPAPVVVVLDDVHHAAAATRRAISQLAAVGPGLLVVACARDEGGEHALADVAGDVAPGVDVTNVRLGALDEQDVARCIDAELGPLADDRAAATRLWRHTGGSPLFLREVLCDLVEQDALVVVDGRARLPAELPVPDGVRATIGERLERLDVDERGLLEHLAVLGADTGREVLDSIAGVRAGGIDVLEARGFVRAGRRAGSVRFEHDLVERVVLERLAPGRLAEMHAAAADAVAARPGASAVEVARHRVAASALDPEAAAAAALAAGATAEAGFAYDEAARWYGAAAKLLAGFDEVDEVALVDAVVREGDALRLAGDARAGEVLRRGAALARRAGTPDLLGRAALAIGQLGPASVAGAADDDALELAERALGRIDDPALAARVAGATSLLLSLAGDPGRCRARFDEGVALARRSGDRAALGDVLPYAYLAVADPDELDHRRALAEEVLELGRVLDDPVTTFEGLHLRFSVELQEASPTLHETHQAMEALAARLHDAGRTWAVGYQAAALAHLRGDLAAAESAAEAALAGATTVSPSRALAVYGVQLLAVRLDAGRAGELRAELDRFVDEQPGIPAWRAARAVAAAGDDPEVVAADFDHLVDVGFLEPPRDFTWTAAVRALGSAVAVAGGAERAERLLEVGAPCSGRLSWAGTCSLGPIDQAIGELHIACGRPEAALASFGAAAEIARRVGARRWVDAAERRAAELRTGGPSGS